MTTIVADACFLIALDGSGNLDLLVKAKRQLGWEVVVPKAVYQESTKKEANKLKALLDDSTLERVDPARDSVDRLSKRYPMLGKGEIEAMGCVLGLEGRTEIVIISDDQRATKAFKEQGLGSVTTLDFLVMMCREGVTSKDELLMCIPRLKKAMWISETAIESFEASLSAM